MKELFIVALSLYCILEILILIRLRSKNKTVAFKSTAISFGLFLILAFLRLFFNLILPYYILLLTIIILVLNSYVGYYLNLYNKSKVFDRYLHAFGSFTFSLLFYYLLSNFMDYGGSETYRTLFIFLLGIALGSLYEVIEYVSDRKNTTKMQKGLKDTNLDNVGNIVGSLVSAVLAYWLIL